MPLRALVMVLGLLLAIAPASAAPAPTLNGRWIVGEVDDNGFDVILEAYGTEAAISPITESPSDVQLRNATLDLTAAPLYKITVLGQLRPNQNGYILLQTENSGIMWLDGNATLMRLRRLGDFVPALQGSWRIGRAPAGEPDTMSLSPRGAQFSGSGASVDAKLFPLVQDDATIDMVLAPQGDTAELFHFQPMPDGSVMVWQERAGNYRVLYKGQRPAWITDVVPDSQNLDLAPRQ